MSAAEVCVKSLPSSLVPVKPRQRQSLCVKLSASFKKGDSRTLSQRTLPRNSLIHAVGRGETPEGRKGEKTAVLLLHSLTTRPSCTRAYAPSHSNKERRPAVLLLRPCCDGQPQGPVWRPEAWSPLLKSAEQRWEERRVSKLLPEPLEQRRMD